MIKLKYEIKKHLGMVSPKLNVVNWNYRKQKYSLRHQKLTDGERLLLKGLKIQHNYDIIFLLPPLNWYRRALKK